ncbi:deoxyribonuclease [Saimiriine alphaherpesvirus 1]|uniref:Deoxyribonuclease n=1 Tax=Saimiriine herpesvirus 1 (strain MV-5-4-PSL) TaxID=10353 RepID=E2IUF8_SHV1|nr:deoxyribonuclease [Saimiriine alphaherpesvirus 1]ADO13816.1 deoxyribonuclease [Saimiriine alphaherpesvirus 1]
MGVELSGGSKRPRETPALDSDGSDASQSLLEDAPAWLLAPLAKRRKLSDECDPRERPSSAVFAPAPPPGEPDLPRLDADTLQRMREAFAALDDDPTPPLPALSPQAQPGGKSAPLADLEPAPAWAPPSIPNTLSASVDRYTFERHLASLAAARTGPLAGTKRLLAAGPLAARADYLRVVAAALEGEGLVERSVASALGGLARGAARAPPSLRAAMLFFEAATRAQSESQLWALLRRGLATASSMRWGPTGPRFPPDWLRGNSDQSKEGSSAAIAFGRTNELTARTLLFRYCVNADVSGPVADEPRFIFGELDDEPEEEGGPHACGLLLDAHTGMVGASLDALVCPRDRSGNLAPRPGSDLAFFEIKCRAKYLFDPLDPRPPIASAYEALLRDRTPRAFRGFVASITKPGVRYFAETCTPGPEEALVTQARDWHSPDVTQTKRRCSPADRRLIELNKGLQSEIVLFGPPDVRRRTICPVRWRSGSVVHREPIFANPRHANFKQILVQAYVLDSHFPAHATRPHLVTFIGRLRRPEEEGLRFELVGDPIAEGPHLRRARLRPEHAIPVAIIVTPIKVDESAFADLRRDSLAAFNAAVSEQRWAKL